MYIGLAISFNACKCDFLFINDVIGKIQKTPSLKYKLITSFAVLYSLCNIYETATARRRRVCTYSL